MGSTNDGAAIADQQREGKGAVACKGAKLGRTEPLRKQSRADAASPNIPPHEVLVALFQKNGNVGKCPGPAVVVIDP